MAHVIHDFVSETTTTTGTGTYSLGGATTGMRAFSSAFSTGDTTEYVVTDGAGNFETGIGTLTTGSPWTLARTLVLESSNSNAAVSWAAGTKTVCCGPVAKSPINTGVTHVPQTTHGFSVKDAIYNTGSAWAKAKADVASTLGIAVVVAVADADNFTLQTYGRVTGLSGLTAGQYYFVSAATAGLLTTTEPTTGYSNPLLFADSTTTGYILPYRPSELPLSGAQSTGYQVEVDFGSTETDSATVTVPATWVQSTSIITCTPASVATTDHDPDDYWAEGVIAYPTNIVASTSFDVVATAPNGTWGKYKINALGRNA